MKLNPSIRPIGIVIPVVAAIFAGSIAIGFDPAYENAPVFYSETEPNNRLTKLFDRIEKGRKIAHRGKRT